MSPLGPFSVPSPRFSQILLGTPPNTRGITALGESERLTLPVVWGRGDAKVAALGGGRSQGWDGWIESALPDPRYSTDTWASGQTATATTGQGEAALVSCEARVSAWDPNKLILCPGPHKTSPHVSAP
jgi:hypothetical protein